MEVSPVLRISVEFFKFCRCLVLRTQYSFFQVVMFWQGSTLQPPPLRRWRLSWMLGWQIFQLSWLNWTSTWNGGARRLKKTWLEASPFRGWWQGNESFFIHETDPFFRSNIASVQCPLCEVFKTSLVTGSPSLRTYSASISDNTLMRMVPQAS